MNILILNLIQDSTNFVVLVISVVVVVTQPIKKKVFTSDGSQTRDLVYVKTVPADVNNNDISISNINFLTHYGLRTRAARKNE